MTLQMFIPEDPTEDDRQTVGAPLLAYNTQHGGEANMRKLAVILMDEAGSRVGGLWGKSVYDWLFVEWLAVPEGHRERGIGTALMAQAEAEALERGCVGIWLDTFEFQARGFYEKLGFEVFGKLDDHPVGQSRYFMRKVLRHL